MERLKSWGKKRNKKRDVPDVSPYPAVLPGASFPSAARVRGFGNSGAERDALSKGPDSNQEILYCNPQMTTFVKMNRLGASVKLLFKMRNCPNIRKAMNLYKTP